MTEYVDFVQKLQNLTAKYVDVIYFVVTETTKPQKKIGKIEKFVSGRRK